MRAIPILLALALLTACGGGGESAPGGGGETATTVDRQSSCTNEREGFTVEYPAGWHTNDGGVAPACSFFHPEPFELPEASEAIGVAAIRVDREQVEFERVAGASFAREIQEREETTVAGRPAVRLEYESTGEALLDAGTRGVDYVVDLGGGETLVASTVDAGDVEFEECVRVLDEMVETIELTH